MPDNFPTFASDVVDLDIPWDHTRPKEAEVKLRQMLSDDRTDARSLEVLTQVARAQALQGRLTDAENSLAEVEKLLPTVQAAAPKLRWMLERGRLLTLRQTPSMARPLFFEAWTTASQAGEDFLAIDAAQMLSVIEPRKMQLEWTKKALEVAERSLEPRVQRWRGSLHLTHGWHFYDLLQFEKAQNEFEAAVECLRRDGDTRKSNEARCCVARALRARNLPEQALAIQRELLAELNKIGVKDGLVFEEMAECLYALKRPDEAQPYFESAYHELSKNQWLIDNNASRIKRLKTLAKLK